MEIQNKPAFVAYLVQKVQLDQMPAHRLQYQRVSSVANLLSLHTTSSTLFSLHQEPYAVNQQEQYQFTYLHTIAQGRLHCKIVPEPRGLVQNIGNH